MDKICTLIPFQAYNGCNGCNIFHLQKDYKRLTRQPSGGWAILRPAVINPEMKGSSRDLKDNEINSC